jgi:outer membrane protein OmpA-like peptidoglycan-associated protein
MRTPFLLIVALLSVTPPTAHAQVTVDLRALNALPAAPAPVARPASSRPAPPPAQHPAAAAAAVPSVAAQPLQPALPEATPAVAALPPVAPSPAPATAPPPPPPVSATAATAAKPVNSGMQVTFAGEQVELSPGSVTAINTLVAAVANRDAATFNVVGYARGKSDDPSTARRVSLARALAVRGALMADGVTSSHIYVRALGTQTDTEPMDRVDIAVMGGNTSETAASSAR